MRNSSFWQSIDLVVLFLGLISHTASAQNKPVQAPIAKLENGNYQFCSQLKPIDWRDGAGICLNFAKVGDQVDGYYGYPHSDVFICIRGTSLENTINGKALGIFASIPQNQLDWDVEHRLRLGPGKIIRSISDRDDRTNWILFQDASLNLQGFYQYVKPQMTPASKLCDWSIVNAPG
jgi:hypothetical protein